MKKITKTINNPKEWEYNGIDKTFKIRNAYGGYECLHNIETYDVVRNPYRSDDVIKITVTYYDEPYSSGDEISASGLTIKKLYLMIRQLLFYGQMELKLLLNALTNTMYLMKKKD